MVIAPDKFRGSATAAEVAEAMARAARAAGWTFDLAPVSDGGEGFCAALGGRARPLQVRGPLGRLVDSAWFELDGGESSLRIAYSGVTPAEIEEGIGRLAEAYREVTAGVPA